MIYFFLTRQVDDDLCKSISEDVGTKQEYLIFVISMAKLIVCFKVQYFFVYLVYSLVDPEGETNTPLSKTILMTILSVAWLQIWSTPILNISRWWRNISIENIGKPELYPPPFLTPDSPSQLNYCHSDTSQPQHESRVKLFLWWNLAPN